VIDSCHGLGLGHGSQVMWVTGQLTDGSRGSRVTKCDPLSALAGRVIVLLASYVSSSSQTYYKTIVSRYILVTEYIRLY